MAGTDRAAAFDYRNCVHCGLCLPKCPTYGELNNENDSPRGRIYLMQAIAEGRTQPSVRIQHHLDLCLDCRACEAVCPSAVPYGQMIESYRGTLDGDAFRRRSLLDRLVHNIALHVLPYPRRTRALVQAARLMRATGLLDYLAHTQLTGRQQVNLSFPEVLERLPPVSSPLPASTPASAAPPVGDVALFLGCVSESLLGETNRATARVLLRNGCSVRCPEGQGCCGAIHYHAGQHRAAADFARRNVDAFAPLLDGLQAIVVNVAGCGLFMKDYGRLLADDRRYATAATRFAGMVQDVSEFLVRLPFEKPPQAVHARVTYHEACHLCHGQRIRSQPRAILQAIPGLELIELRESDWCCGAAGTYSLTQPEMSAQLAQRKLHHVDETRSQLVAAANAACILHLRQHALRSGRNLQILHPIDLLDRAYHHGGEPPA